ncbi:MAG TPA: hypothetical protein VMS17_13230 [Gemmataceae bacterium]|nr:hypothetical protein [Gemmataceae bacterium]
MQQRSFLAALFLALFAAPALCAPSLPLAADPDMIQVHIQVVYSGSGKGVAGVHLAVTIDGQPQPDLITDKNGVRDFPVPIGSKCQIVFYYGGVKIFNAISLYAVKDPPPPSIPLLLEAGPTAKLEPTAKLDRLLTIQKCAAVAVAKGGEQTPPEILHILKDPEFAKYVQELSNAPDDEKLARLISATGKETQEALAQIHNMP